MHRTGFMPVIEFFNHDARFVPVPVCREGASDNRDQRSLYSNTPAIAPRLSRIYIRGYGSIRGQNEIISLCKWTRRTKLVVRRLSLACSALVFHPLSLFPSGKAGRKKTSRIIGANPFFPFSLSPRLPFLLKSPTP